MTDLGIREARVEDAAGLARVQVDSYRSAYANIFPEEYLAAFTYEEQARDWQDLVRSPGSQLVYVAETGDGDIAGYALADTTDRADYTSELVALHVREEHQHRGVGRALIAAVARRLRSNGHGSLLLSVLEDNVRARRLYEQLGGRPAGEKEIEVGDGIHARELVFGWPDIGVLCEDTGSLTSNDPPMAPPESGGA